MAIERWLARQEDIVVDKLRYRNSGSDSSCSAMKKESQEHVPCSLYINFLMQLEPANQAFDHSAYSVPRPLAVARRTSLPNNGSGPNLGLEFEQRVHGKSVLEVRRSSVCIEKPRLGCNAPSLEVLAESCQRAS